MAKIIFFEPGVVMGLWLGIVFAVFAIVVVNLKSFELSLKQYRFWRTILFQREFKTFKVNHYDCKNCKHNPEP